MARRKKSRSTTSRSEDRAGRALPPQPKPEAGAAAAGQRTAAATTTGAQDEARRAQRWQGPVDPDGLNDTLLRYMRSVDEKVAITEAEQARRSHMTRQQLHQLHTAVKVLTIPALVRWANGRQIDAGFLMWKVGDFLRQQTTRR